MTPEHFGKMPQTAGGMSDKDMIFGAFQHAVAAGPSATYERLCAATSQSELVQLIAEFNASPAEERGKGRYDHSRPLTEHVDRPPVDLHTMTGYPYTATLHRNGEVTLATSLG